jgi:N-ethylmaleimide reductase
LPSKEEVSIGPIFGNMKGRKMATLFDPVMMGDIQCSNRIVMAPLTRMRAKMPGNIPHELNAQYYAQRSSAGLIVSEATQISQQGQGYPLTPGIYTQEQIQGWKLVTKAVHQQGGRIVLQLWHVGRISHRSHQPQGALPVAPSAIKPNGGTYSADFKEVAFETPRALDTQEVKEIVNDYRQAAINAKEAGFDGVEVHGANGYLLDQFLQDGSNQRSDQYGGSIENRARFLLEVVDAVINVWGHKRVGVRLSPYGTFNDMKDSDPIALFSYVIRELDKRHIAYVHLIEPRSSAAGMQDGNIPNAPQASVLFRSLFKGVLISAGGHTPQSAQDDVKQGLADAVAFGRLFIANPDLVERIKKGLVLNKYDRTTFYGGAQKGYTDYPVFQQ